MTSTTSMTTPSGRPYATAVRIGRACGLLCGREAEPRCTIAEIRLCRECFRRVHRIRRAARAAANARATARSAS